MRTHRHLSLPLLRLALAAGLAGCTSQPAGPAASTLPPTTVAPATAAPGTTLDPRQAVIDAYLATWQVYADAMRTLDPAKLPSAFAGRSLRTVQDEVADQKAKGEPILIDIVHHPELIYLKDDEAVVRDHYENRSVALGPDGTPPTQTRPPTRVYQRRSLKRLGGTWKVVLIIEEQRPR